MLRSFTAAALLAVLCTPAGAAVLAEAGWQADAFAAPALFLGGMDYLPNGNLAVFDGADVVELDAAGNPLNVLFHAGPVFGSFVKVDPTGTFLLFGESSNQQVFRIPLDGSTPSVVTNITFNYDLAFASASVAYVSAGAALFGNTDLLRLDLVSGAVDLIAQVDGPSGPIALDAQGNLYFGEGTLTFPPPAGQQSVRRFTAAQVAGAIGPSHLTTAQSSVFIGGLTNPADIVIDEEGDFFVSDGTEGAVRQYSRLGALKGVVATEAPFNFVSNLALHGSGVAGRFDAFQPETAGTLAVLSTDFFSFTDIARVRPRRPDIAATPASPIPDGPLAFDVVHGPPGGTMLLLISGAAPVQPEVLVDSLGTSWFFGVNLALPFVQVLAPLDANGELHVSAGNGPSDAGSATLQAILLDAQGHGAGTSNPLAIALQ